MRSCSDNYDKNWSKEEKVFYIFFKLVFGPSFCDLICTR